LLLDATGGRRCRRRISSRGNEVPHHPRGAATDPWSARRLPDAATTASTRPPSCSNDTSRASRSTRTPSPTSRRVRIRRAHTGAAPRTRRHLRASPSRPSARTYIRSLSIGSAKWSKMRSMPPRVGDAESVGDG